MTIAILALAAVAAVLVIWTPLRARTAKDAPAPL